MNSEQVFNQRFWSFRPLPRDLISQLGYKSANDFIKLGFRPLPGDLISQFVLTARTTEIFRIGFRPLPGDLISQSDLDYEVAKYEDVFPSPSRGSYFSIISEVSTTSALSMVSVPFPGILFLNDSTEHVTQLNRSMFPSPSRGSYFSICNCEDREDAKVRFRPLPGDLISQSCPLHA